MKTQCKRNVSCSIMRIMNSFPNQETLAYCRPNRAQSSGEMPMILECLKISTTHSRTRAVRKETNPKIKSLTTRPCLKRLSLFPQFRTTRTGSPSAAWSSDSKWSSLANLHLNREQERWAKTRSKGVMVRWRNRSFRTRTAGTDLLTKTWMSCNRC